MKGVVEELVALVGGHGNGHYGAAGMGRGRRLVQAGEEGVRQVLTPPRQNAKLLAHNQGKGVTRIIHEKFLKEERVSAKMLLSPK